MTPTRFDHVRAELLLPWQLRERLTARSVVYLPLGTLEWHGEHLPIGLDALTAHGVCLRAAAEDGGVVLPPLHFGTGGDHGNYPWTVMMPSASEIEAQVMYTLSRFETMQVTRFMIFSGHFADTQLEMIDRIANNWNARNSSLKVVATSVNRIEGLAIPPDHAGVFETTLLYALHPELVQINRLPLLSENPLVESDGWSEGRHDPTHPIWGVIGPDPRKFDARQSLDLLKAMIGGLLHILHHG